MKKEICTKVIVFIAMFFLPFLLWSQGYGVRLEESFENGIPADWTQENVKGNISWVVNSGDLTYPDGAFDGKSRVEFRGNSNVTTKSRTRLITPAMDIQGIYQPILVFAHAQSTWTDDFDTLKVLYRASADKEWTVLKVFDSPIKKWERDTVRLIGGSKTYQIAFEASDNLGRGVVIDTVLVRSTPRCAEPYGLNVGNILNESATIGWFNDGDAKTLSLKVSTVALTNEQLADENFKANVLDTLVAKNLYRYNLTGLAAGTKYYFYLRANCGEDISGWTSADFVTSNVIKPGYTQNFNNRSTGVTHPLYCYVGSSENVVPPYINASASSAIKKALSPDASSVVCFNAEVDDNAAKALPSSSYAYFALPQIELDENKKISDLYVSFTTINHKACNSDISSIIVGVMTDPVDYYSFEAVDTVNITSMRTFEECFVSLEKYAGEGKFIAFISEFESSNIFVMDNLKVDYRPEVLKVNNFQMSLLSATQVKFDFPFSYNQYEVVLAEKVMTVAELDAATPQVVANGGTLTVKPATHYYVYARGLKGANKGEWSSRRILHTVGQVNALPYDLVIDINREKTESYYSLCYENSDVQTGGVLMPNMISLGNCEAMFSAKNISTSRWIFEAKVGESNKKCWTALVCPELTVDLATTRMTFEVESPDNNGTVVVGSMTDARDISTFKPLTTISAVKGYSYHYLDFVNYEEMEGKFIAMLVEQENGVSEVVNSIRIDKIKFLTMPSCGNVTNVDAVAAADPSKVVISWDATNADAWVVCISKSQFTYEGIDRISNWYYRDTVTTNSVEISNLEAPGRKYYYTVRAVCDGISGEWTHPASFETGCYDVQPIPYVENFDNLDQAAYSPTQGFKVPCMATQQVQISAGGGDAYYPQVQQEGNTYGVFMRRGDYTENKNLYLAMPKMAEPINELQISFDAKLKSGLVAGISVGVMTNPYDSTTFEEVATMTTTRQGEFVKFVATLDSYKGTGEYIAIALNNDCKYDSYFHGGVEILFDNIKVDFLNPCARPESVTIDSYDSDRVKLRWRSPATVSKWRVLFAKSRLSESELANIHLSSGSGRVLKMEEVTSNPCTITGLPVNTEYFIYVQPLCDTVNGAWSDVVTFRTPCAVKPIGELEIEGFENYITVNVPGSLAPQIHPECWTVGTTNEDEHDEGYDIGNYIPHCVTPETPGFGNAIYKGNSSLLIQTVKNFNGAYAISNKIGVDDISKLYMKLMGRYNGDLISGTSELSGSIVVGVVTEPTRLNTFIPVDTLSFVKGEYLPYEVYFDSYEGDQYGDKGQYVMFLADFGPEVKVNVCIDEVEFDTVSPCKTNLVIDSIGVESIRVKIVGGQAPYQVKYSKSTLTEDILNGNAVDSIVSDTNIFEIPNLTRVTTYYLSARSSCDGGYTDWAMIEKVKTDWNRVISLPYFDDFENQPSVKQTTPECWYSLYTGSAKYPYPYVYGASQFYPRGTHGIYMYLTKSTGATTYLVTPEIDVDSLSRCQVSFYQCNGASNKRRNVIVGAVSDVNDIAGTFEPIDTLIFDSYPNFVATNVTVPLDKYKGTAKHIAFTSCLDYCQKYSTTKGWIADASQLWFTIDDILIELIPTCFPGTDFKMVGHTDTSLEIEFTHEGAPQYEVKYGAVGFNVDTAGTSMIVDAVTHFTIENLTPNTEYDVHVRTICDDGEKSKWGYAGKYRTAPEAVRTMPYSFNFNDSTEAAKWAFAQNGQTNQWFIGVDDAKVVADKGGKALYISNDTAKSAHYSPDVTSRAWASRTIALEAGVYTITYDWTCFGEANNDYIRVGFLPTTSQFTAGSATVVNLDGTSGALGNVLSENRIQNWIELSSKSGLNGVDTTKAMANQWQTVEKVVIVTPEMAGTYNLVFYWVNNDTIGEYAAKRSAVIDNVNITRASCTPPYDLKLVSINANEAKMSISSTVSDVAYEVVAFADTLTNVTENDLAFRQQVNANTVTINGLTAGVNYKVYIRAICSEGNYSIWVGPFEVTTSCNPIELNTVLTMDNEDEHYSIGTSTGLIEVQKSLPNCFVSGHENANMSANYAPSLVKSTANEKYSRSGDYALKLSTQTVNKEAVAGDYVVLPLLNADFETSQVNFWMRCVTNDATGKVIATGAGDAYARKITVGTMTNPYDPTTFVAIGTYEYSYTVSDMGANITNDVSGNNYWIEVSVPLIGAEGDFVAFKNEGYNATNNVVYIDDIEFVEVSCYTPNSLKVSNITSNSANIDFNHSDNAVKYLIQRADNAEFANASIVEVTSLPFKMENLAAATNYYVKVQTICDKDTSNWSSYIMFATNRTTPYAESFDGIVNNMNGWMTSNSATAADCFAGATLDCIAKLSSDTWTTKGGITGSSINTMHLSTKVDNLSLLPDAAHGSKTWLISPVIDLANALADYHLLFDVALTDKDSNKAPSADDEADKDDKFMVIISEDEGATWNRANATIWGSTADDYEYFSIPTSGKRYEIDLTKYAGKQIKIAFYTEANKSGASTEIHLDNVHVNAYVEDIVVAPVCQTEGFENRFFAFDSEELTVGRKDVSYWELHAEVNQVDTLRGVQLNILPMSETILEAQICEGDVYALNGFPALTEPGRYKQKVTSANGCDSVIVLNLSTTPTQRVTTMDTICHGTSLMWNGKEYNRTGVYGDTLISSLGCDSIVTLILKVNDPIEVEEYVNICYGESYTFGSQTITETCDVRETFKTADGCDSIVLLHATVLPDYRLILNEFIKEGEKYSGHGFDGLSKTGTYSLPLTSKDDCDSTIVLNLTVLTGDTTYVDFTITTDNLPYEYESISYDESTAPGVYVDTITVVKDEAVYVIVHTLTITQGTAVDDTRNFDLIMVPNPLKVNSTLFINADFTDVEREGLLVEVFNAVGQRIYVETPTIYPIAVEGLNTTGVYVVRVITGNGKSYLDKVIVE